MIDEIDVKVQAMTEAVQRLQQVACALVPVLRVPHEENAVPLLLHVFQRPEDVRVGAVVDHLQLSRREMQVLLNR
jgi:hypothetical protein